MCDKLVFDLSQEVEGSPNVFIRKDWINILDNQNQNYQNNQSIIDTSQISNSNKYMSYRESYLAVPLLLSLVTPQTTGCDTETTTAIVNGRTVTTGNADYSIGLKNWFGSIIHSFTLDYNGTTIIQQTPFCNMWNSFKLLTTLSYSDILTQGPTIGFYPDTSDSWSFSYQNTTVPVAGAYGNSYNGKYTSNNDINYNLSTTSSVTENQGQVYDDVNGSGGNIGLLKRISWINFNPRTVPVNATSAYGVQYANGAPVGVLQTNLTNIWKSYIINQQNALTAAPPALGVSGCMQIAVMATIYLKHVHSFFNMIPLLKGVFMKITMNLNNASTSITIAAAGAPIALDVIQTYNSSVPVGGIMPLLIPSIQTGSQNVYNQIGAGALNAGTYWYNISVGARVTDNNVTATGYALPSPLIEGTLSKSIYLYVPAYTFNPVFEQAYLSNPIKQIKYTDIYQYQVLNTPPGSQFNNLITNGISNIKSILIIPFFSANNNYGATSYTQPSPSYQSPFDPAGSGPTSPMVTLGNFNIQISGQNAIYNTQRYTFEEFNNQLYGQNAVNGGLTDGLTSGLISFYDFQQSYCYYYVNVERMLPVEQSVPKSVQVLGTNYSTQSIDMWVFVEYGVEINVDLQTGARV
jgi:hypothetical protein